MQIGKNIHFYRISRNPKLNITTIDPEGDSRNNSFKLTAKNTQGSLDFNLTLRTFDNKLKIKSGKKNDFSYSFSRNENIIDKEKFSVAVLNESLFGE